MTEEFDRFLDFGTVNGAFFNLGYVFIGFA
jgi:hypothetical protein